MQHLETLKDICHLFDHSCNLLSIVLAVDRQSVVKGTKIASGRSPIYKGFY